MEKETSMQIQQTKEKSISKISGQLSNTINATKLKDLGLDKVLQLVKYIIVLIGLSKSNLPTEMEMDILTRKMRESFSNYTIADFELAIDLAGEKKLISDLGNGKTSIFSLTLYDRPLSITFLKELMASYRIYKQSHPEYKKLLSHPVEKIPTKAEIYNDLRNGLNELWLRFAKGEDISRDLGWWYYDTLTIHSGLLNPTDDRKMEYFKDALQKEQEKIRIENFGKFNSNGTIEKISGDSVKESAKKRAKEALMLQYFMDLKEMEMELELPRADEIEFDY